MYHLLAQMYHPNPNRSRSALIIDRDIAAANAAPTAANAASTAANAAPKSKPKPKPSEEPIAVLLDGQLPKFAPQLNRYQQMPFKQTTNSFAGTVVLHYVVPFIWRFGHGRASSRKPRHS
jgi:hypothetical protein